MRLDGFGIFVKDMKRMIRFYRDVPGFEIKETEDAVNVYLIKDDTLFMLYGRENFEEMTGRKYEYVKGLNAHFEIALYAGTFGEVDKTFAAAVSNVVISMLLWYILYLAYINFIFLSVISYFYKHIKSVPMP